MANAKKATHKKIQKKRKRKLRSEAVVILILLSLLLFLLTSMGLSLLLTGELPVIPGIEDVFPQTSEAKASNGKTIVVDPGHGGYDAGGNVGTIYEKDLTLQIGSKLGEELKSRGYNVIYTRTEDTSLGEYEIEDLNNRVAIGENNQADALISLHTNQAEEGIEERCYGFEVYQNEENAFSMVLAEHVNEKLKGLDYTASRGVLNGDIYHIVQLNAQSAILIELGFLDDDADRNYLASAIGQTRIVQALADAMDASFGFESE